MIYSGLPVLSQLKSKPRNRYYSAAGRMAISAVIVSAALFVIVGCTRKVEEITADELRAHVSYLASDALQGRYTGTPGVTEAEEYIADFFEGLGLTPLPGEDDFFLEFQLHSFTYDRNKTGLTINGVDYTLGEGFRPFRFSADGSIESEIIFAGYGITAPEYNYDDYAGLDVAGKIVVVMRHEPDETGTGDRFDGPTHTRHAYFKTKAENAAAHGAAGMLLYTDPLHHGEDDDLRVVPAYSFVDTRPDPRRISEPPVAGGFIAFHISRKVASALLPGVDLSSLQAAVDAGQEIEGFLGEHLRVTARMSQTIDTNGQTVSARDVAAFLPGTAADKGEWIVVGAHHDHIGAYAGEGDTVFNGADDNASGVAGVLELAEQFTANPAQRPMVFMTFSAEEIGLFGSYALDRYDLIDLKKVGFMLNLDMIGRNPETPVEIYGDGLAEGLTDLVLEANSEPALDISLQGSEYVPFSDIAVFHDNRIPFLMIFTGEHPDYHGTGDHWEKLDYDRMEKLLILSYDILDLAAGAERLPRYK